MSNIKVCDTCDSAGCAACDSTGYLPVSQAEYDLENPVDFRVENQGTVIVFEAVSDDAKDFVQHHVHVEPWQWCGSKGITRFAVDHRPAHGLRNLLVDESFVLEYN